jgi:hypothetical protein
MKTEWVPDTIDPALVFDGFVFRNHNARGRYIGTDLAKRPQWLKDNPDKWCCLKAIREKAAQRTNSDDVIATVQLDASLSNLDANNFANGVAGAAAKLPVDVPLSSDLSMAAPETDTTPLGVIHHTRGPSGDRRRKKRKPSAGSSKSAPKLSPEHMIIVLESLEACPILARAAEKAGIHRKTLEYWLRCSEAGHDGYDLVWQDVLARFHVHCEAAIYGAHQELLDRFYTIAMGVKYPGSEAYVTPPNMKMLRFLLEWMCPEVWGKRRKVKATQRSAVLVVGGPAKKREYNTAASVQARQWKSRSKMVRKATD